MPSGEYAPSSASTGTRLPKFYPPFCLEKYHRQRLDKRWGVQATFRLRGNFRAPGSDAIDGGDTQRVQLRPIRGSR